MLISLFFVSCVSPEPKNVKANEKAFAQEDTYILLALHAEQIKDYKSASKLFETLYNKSHKKEYLYRSLENDLVAKDSQKLINRVDALNATSASPDSKLTRLKVVALFELDRMHEAEVLSIALAKKTQKPDDYLLVSDVLIKSQKYDMALKYLDGAYIKEYNEKILDKMSIILYVNLNRKTEAIAYLETHTRMHGTSKLIGQRLIGFYSDANNVDGLLSIYLRVYKIDNNKKVAQKIIQIYSYKRDYLHLIDFLEESKSDDSALLELYSATKNYSKAYPLANELYEKTAKLDYLGQSAINEYQSLEAKDLNSSLSRIIDNLTIVVESENNPRYTNYLGYILIDHDVDVKKGMEYIREVLKLEPESGYYLDSLAWGYYKLNKCSKAKKLMNKIVKFEGGDDPEVLDHLEKINQCLKIKKGKNRK